MDPVKVAAIKTLISQLVGPTGCYVLMMHDGSDTQAWADGDGRVKMRGLLDVGNEYLRGELTLGWKKPQPQLTALPPLPPAEQESKEPEKNDP